MDYPRLNLTSSSKLRYINHVEFHNSAVTPEQCTDVLISLALDPNCTYSEIGLLSLLYAHALKGGSHRDIQCSEYDLQGLSAIKYAYPYITEDGKLHVRLFMVGEEKR